MVTLAHTDALPKCDKIIVYALEKSDPSDHSALKPIPEDRAFPIRPYKSNARVLETKTLSGGDVEELTDTWRSMTFDEFGGAFCHFPVYGLRFYRDSKLLFETSICWKCTNFYLPQVGPEDSDREDGLGYQLYGFKYDQQAKKLLTQIRRQLEHPALKSEK